MINIQGVNIDKIALGDAQGIVELMNSNVLRFQRYFPKTLEQNRTLGSSKAFVEKKVKQFKLNEEFLFIIKKGLSVIGMVYIKELDWSKKQGEFAYCISERYEGKGITTSAVKALSSYAFAKLGLEVLQIMVHKENIPSVMVAKNCGFSWQKTALKSYAPPNEAALDMELYELYK